MKLRRLSTRQAGFEVRLSALTRYEESGNSAVERVVRSIIADVRKRGDAAVLAYARRFDRVKASSVGKLEVPRGWSSPSAGGGAVYGTAESTMKIAKIPRWTKPCITLVRPGSKVMTLTNIAKTSRTVLAGETPSIRLLLE